MMIGIHLYYTSMAIRNPYFIIPQKYYGIGRKKWGEKRKIKQATQQHVLRCKARRI